LNSRCLKNTKKCQPIEIYGHWQLPMINPPHGRKLEFLFAEPSFDPNILVKTNPTHMHKHVLICIFLFKGLFSPLNKENLHREGER